MFGHNYITNRKYLLQMLDFVINKEEITYLYKVKDGSVSSSFAHLAATGVGLSKNIVDRAKEVIEL